MENSLEILDNIFLGLKFKDAIYKEASNTCVINFLYNPDEFKPNEENKKILKEKLNEIVGDFVNYELNFINCPLDKRAIANYTYTTIKNNFPTLSKDFTFDDIAVETENMKVKIKLRISPYSFEYATDLNREELVANKLKESFLADFSVTFVKKEDIVADTSFIEKNMEFMASIKEAEEKTIYELSEITDIIGKNEYSTATDFTKVKSPITDVVICGEVMNIQRKTYKRSYTRDGKKTEIERIFYSFAIKNDGKVMYCSIFPKQTDEAKGDLIEVGMKICCLGSFKEFNSHLNFTATTIARCEYKREEIKSAFKHVNADYHIVFPQEYVDYEQAGLFDETAKEIEGTYVVFDLETTGLESAKDEIIEIGACKIINGKIDSVFSTFVKPSISIPAEITDLTGITDDMVKDAPPIAYVLPDFYKFCYGSTMVGHNVSFDIGFIYAVAKKYSYNFDNPLMDTMAMAHEKLPGLKNYKLGTIVNRLNVVLDNAHRAINDATATAKVFLKLI